MNLVEAYFFNFINKTIDLIDKFELTIENNYIGSNTKYYCIAMNCNYLDDEIAEQLGISTDEYFCILEQHGAIKYMSLNKPAVQFLDKDTALEACRHLVLYVDSIKR